MQAVTWIYCYLYVLTFSGILYITFFLRDSSVVGLLLSGLWSFIWLIYWIPCLNRFRPDKVLLKLVGVVFFFFFSFFHFIFTGPYILLNHTQLGLFSECCSIINHFGDMSYGCLFFHITESSCQPLSYLLCNYCPPWFPSFWLVCVRFYSNWVFSHGYWSFQS